MKRNEITDLLAASREGDRASFAQLSEVVYTELRGIAEAQLRRESSRETLQPTALVNELFVRLVQQRSIQPRNREEFFATAAGIMRKVLIDYHRRRRADKRRGGERIPLEDVEPSLAMTTARTKTIDLIDLDAALTDFESLDPRRSRLVELRFFGGLTLDDAADAMGISRTSVKRDWRIARAWLIRRLGRVS